MRKKIAAFFVIIALVCSSFAINTFADAEYKFYLCGDEVSPSQVKLKGSTYMISAKSIESLGITAEYYAGGSRAWLHAGNTVVVIEADNDTVYVNGESVNAGVAPCLESGELFIPLDLIIDILGFQAVYDGEKKTCNIELSAVETALRSAQRYGEWYVSDELLKNSSFEEKISEQWTPRLNCEIERTEADARDGKFSALVTHRESGWSAIHQNVLKAVNEYGPGKYWIHGSLKTVDSGCEMTIKLALTNVKNQKLNIADKPCYVAAGEWTDFDYVTDAVWTDTLTNALFYCESTSNTGKASEIQDYYADNLSLTKLMSESEYREMLEAKYEPADAGEVIRSVPYQFLLDGEKSDKLDIITQNNCYLISSESLENLGVKVFYYNDKSKALFYYNGVSITAENGDSGLYVKDDLKQAETASMYENERLYVPLDLTLRELGFQVKYSLKSNECNIYIASEIERRINSSERVDGMYPSEELLSNESFEQDFTLAGGWSNRVSSTVKQSGDYARTGRYSGLVTDRKSGWASISQDVSQVLTEYGPGKYRIRGCLRTADEPCRMTVKIKVTNSEGVGINSESAEGGILTVTNDGWTEFDYIADLRWDLSISSAAFYCEATSSTGKTAEVQDFYVDDCSLIKLMTDEEYFSFIEDKVAQEKENSEREKTEKDREDALLEKYASDTLETYYPHENREILKNPYKGLIIYPGTQVFKEETANWAGGTGSILYHRYSWCYIEPEEGVYNWDMFDKNIELCKKYGMQFGLGIGSTLNYNSASSYNQDTPDWVFEAGCGYTVEDMGNGVKIKVPDYDDPIFREKMQNMIDAFSERYNDNEVIAYVDMRNYGNWGEWHFYNMPVNNALDAKRTNEQYFAYIDMFKDMRLPALSFVAKPDVTKHATETFGAGIRGDGLVAPAEMDKHRNMKLVENKAMAVGEWFEQYTTVYLPGGKYSYAFDSVPILFERQVREGAISCMAFLNWDADTAYKTWTDMYNRAANYVGYWYKPVKIEHSENITKGIFRMKVKNDGVAPLFAGYEKKAVVKLALADSNNKIIDTVTLEGFDPLYWRAGTMTDCLGEYEFKNTQGAKKLLMGVFTKESNEEPNVKLGIEAEMIGNWYDISSMAKTDSNNLAHNKLFDAYALYADEGYGFRRPEYACDNDASTYWANDCVDGNYLEVDFGEEKTVSQVVLTAAESINLKYSIQIYRHGKWRTVANGVSISSLGTTLRFRSETCEKLRIVIDEERDAVVKICEMKVV